MNAVELNCICEAYVAFAQMLKLLVLKHVCDSEFSTFAFILRKQQHHTANIVPHTQAVDLYRLVHSVQAASVCGANLAFA